MFFSFIFLVLVSFHHVSTEGCSCDFNMDVCQFGPINETDSWKWSGDEQPPFILSNDSEYVWIKGVAGLSDVLLISPLLTNVTPETEFSFDCYISSTTVSLYGQFIREGDAVGNVIWLSLSDVVPSTWSSIRNVNCDPTGHGLCCGRNVSDYPCNGRFAIQFLGFDNSSYAGLDNFNSTASCDPITTSSTYQDSTGTDEMTTYQDSTGTDEMTTYQDSTGTDETTTYQDSTGTDGITTYQDSTGTDEMTTYTEDGHTETMSAGSTTTNNETVSGSTEINNETVTGSTETDTETTPEETMFPTSYPVTPSSGTTGIASTLAPIPDSKKFTQYEMAIIILMSVATFVALTTAIIVLARTLKGCRISSKKSSLNITSFS